MRLHLAHIRALRTALFVPSRFSRPALIRTSSRIKTAFRTSSGGAASSASADIPLRRVGVGVGVGVGVAPLELRLHGDDRLVGPGPGPGPGPAAFAGFAAVPSSAVSSATATSATDESGAESAATQHTPHRGGGSCFQEAQASPSVGTGTAKLATADFVELGASAGGAGAGVVVVAVAAGGGGGGEEGSGSAGASIGSAKLGAVDFVPVSPEGLRARTRTRPDPPRGYGNGGKVGRRGDHEGGGDGEGGEDGEDGSWPATRSSTLLSAPETLSIEQQWAGVDLGEWSRRGRQGGVADGQGGELRPSYSDLEVRSVLGQGGFGTVFLAHHMPPEGGEHEDVAVKIFRRNESDPSQVRLPPVHRCGMMPPRPSG